MLSADGSSSASSAWRSEIASPAATATSESPPRACDGTYAVISLAALAIGTGRVAPRPSVTPMPLMSAAETPPAGHETAPSRSWLGVAVPARGATVPEGEVAWGWGATGPEGDVFSSPVVQPGRRVRPAAPGFP
jgi:hypothetical protein